VYSILPAFVSALFLGFGIYALSIKGVNRVSLSFFFLCVTTAFWQGLWAVLFQTSDVVWANLLVRAGYVLILYLPTCFYLFLIEVCDKGSDRPYVVWSYGLASLLVVSLLSGNAFVAGEYRYFFGYYPKAGLLHPVHLVQTALLAARCFWITYQRLKQSGGREHAQIRLCLIGFCIYTFAALDYLCNYGVEFYPPGVVFLVASVGCFAWAIIRYDLLNPYSIAASVAHEMRSPLVAIKLLSDELGESLPALLAAHRVAVEQGLMPDAIGAQTYARLEAIPQKIALAMRQSTATIDKFLAVTRELDVGSFSYHKIDHCVAVALEEYPFMGAERDLIRYEKKAGFEFHGSSDLLVFVLFNLIKNALWAVRSARKGTIAISTYETEQCYVLAFKDTAIGIDPDVLPYVFEEFFTTRRNSGGTGVGLSFCRQVMQAFGGAIRCLSEKGQHTTFLLEFPRARP